MARTAYRPTGTAIVSFELLVASDVHRSDMDLSVPFTILVVDDDPDHCFLVRRRLELSGFSVRTAPDTELALQSLSGVDLVLLDHGLPDATGLDVLPQLRELGLSVVMVTGMGSES